MTDAPQPTATRQLDAQIEERVFGRTILGFAPVCGWQDQPGECVELEGEPDDHAGVWVRDCACDHYAELERDGLTSEPRVFGHTWQCLEVARCYSTEIAAAFAVVERMHGPPYGDVVSIHYKQGCVEPFAMLAWEVEFRLAGVRAADVSLPIAICKAALLPVEGRGK